MNGARKESHLEVSAYLTFKGDCEAAFKCYEEVLGAKSGLLFRYADSPMADVLLMHDGSLGYLTVFDWRR
jgi:uncharacterized glyoxalase superfamily protein PhnB